MIKTLSNGIGISNGKQREIPGEKNDCTVRALANALDIPYLEAYGMMIGFGRKQRKGLIIESCYDSLGFIKHPRPGMTVENYVKYIAHSGNWIIKIRGHVFAVVEKTILDINPEWNLGRHVVFAWKVK